MRVFLLSVLLFSASEAYKHRILRQEGLVASRVAETRQIRRDQAIKPLNEKINQYWKDKVHENQGKLLPVTRRDYLRLKPLYDEIESIEQTSLRKRVAKKVLPLPKLLNIQEKEQFLSLLAEIDEWFGVLEDGMYRYKEKEKQEIASFVTKLRRFIQPTKWDQFNERHRKKRPLISSDPQHLTKKEIENIILRLPHGKNANEEDSNIYEHAKWILFHVIQ